MSKYIIQKAVNLEAVVKKRAKPLWELEKTYLMQFKYDGCCVVINPFNLTSMSRTGELVQSMGEIERRLMAFDQLKGMVLIGEAWHPTWNFSKISGEFRRYKESSGLWFVIFDCLTEAEFAAGRSDVPYVTRQARYKGVRVDTRIIPAYTGQPGLYGSARAQADRHASTPGYDGIILRDPLGTWTAGSGTTGEIIKIKRILSYDLKVTGVFQAVGEKTGRAVYTLSVDYNGRELMIGSGVPHDEEDLPKVGDTVEIEALDESSKGLLREPRYKGIRTDS